VPASVSTSTKIVTDYHRSKELRGLLLRSLKYGFRPRPQVRVAPEEPAGEPLVSIIIPTYNRSNVLRLAIHSVLWQTEQNFEILVMGDGCTDDSEAVALSFGDARVRWQNLPQNTGHQTAAVNLGLEMSRGRYIAFLGHDDVWHPEHLRSMLGTITRRAAGIATALVEFIGPKGTNYRVIEGIYPVSGYNPVKSFAPSGVMMTREVYDKIGKQPDYRTIWRNPDAEYQYQAHLAGFQFASTGELTVFKFNSAQRKNSYVEKTCHEQTAYVNRIQEQRWFLFREMLAVARIHWRRLPIQVLAVPPPPTPETPGWYVSQYRKIRGLE
jgi:glycosyltransferase involved in cell wall biosynthesis